MRLSALDLVPVSGGLSVQQAVAHCVDLARTVEELGFQRFWLAEHHGSPHLAGSSPEVMIARIASATARIRVGSGAVLLPYYSPLKVVENFNTLTALFPGRIDLGLGRGPGASPSHAAHLMGRGLADAATDYGDDVLDVLAYLDRAFPEDDERHAIVPSPLSEEHPDVWLLGTSVQSATLAGELGLPYCVATFLRHEPADELIRQYRTSFANDGWTNKPYAMLAASIVCAGSDAEATELAYQGNEMPMEGTLIGSAETVRAELESQPVYEQVDELMVTTLIHDYERRKASYCRLAETLTS